MKAKNIGLLISGAVGGCLMSLAPANAAILVEPIITKLNPDFQDGVGIPFNLQPGELTFWNVPDTTGEQNFLNDTGLAIDSISFILLPGFDTLDDDLAWGDVNGDGKIGISNIFTNINVDPDFTFQPLSIPQSFSAPRIDFAAGIIPLNERFVVQFLTTPDIRPVVPGDNGPLVVGGVYFASEPVPEPSTILGSVFAIGLGGYLKKCKSSRKK
ncbi:PEP-CTERM sorting domain-containing protein [Nostoc sp. CALU 546]|uniref:PEP-CTERM sorting domain-containing protein n=1 Tax=Nostoc sp. CALU 546 TaxID=1867241 RepID=UPI003B67E83D